MFIAGAYQPFAPPSRASLPIISPRSSASWAFQVWVSIMMLGEGLAGASVHPTGGRISIGLERLVHGFDVVHAVAGEGDELVVIVLGELVKDLVPLRSS